MKRTESFQNLLLIIAADGVITPTEKDVVDQFSYSLGITDEEYSYYVQNIRNLSFVIPDTKEEAGNELFSMILVCLESGELNEREETALLGFALQAGFSEDEFYAIVNYTIDKRNKEQQQTTDANKQSYEWAVAGTRQSGKTDAEIANILVANVVQPHNLTYQFSEDEEINRAFYGLVWSVFHRYQILRHPTGIVLTTMRMDLIKSGDCTLDDLLEDLIVAEEAVGDGKSFNLQTAPLAALIEDLKHSFPFNNN
ncbi:hypothetical protein [Xanthocytophaga flava]|uniref:hypothetical protein n=1 Tax=Xanthocytophaga flava TaxID=3048013 RepID=UPI0028D3B589|nr:hypothetical protein [Xanthocytophaga flavus]MDJ1471062.1 hypothetical protein [Xanthocytophaga flavus]